MQGEKIIDVMCLAQRLARGIIRGEPELLPSSMWGKASPSFLEKLLCDVGGRPGWAEGHILLSLPRLLREFQRKYHAPQAQPLKDKWKQDRVTNNLDN